MLDFVSRLILKMSFEQQLCEKKSQLKSTSTIITDTEGNKFLETGDKIVALEERTHGFVVDTKPDNLPARITDFVYLGSQDCCEFPVLDAYNIEYVLSIGILTPCMRSSGTYKCIPCLDIPDTDIVDILINDCVAFIDEAIKQEKKILVHCNAGVSRSSAIVIGYIMIKDCVSYAEAYEFVKSKRECIKPNDGFKKQLEQLELRLVGEKEVKTEMMEKLEAKIEKIEANTKEMETKTEEKEDKTEEMESES